MKIKSRYTSLRNDPRPTFSVKLDRAIPLESSLLDNICEMPDAEVRTFMRLVVSEGYKALAKSSGIDVSHLRDFRTPELFGKKLRKAKSVEVKPEVKEQSPVVQQLTVQQPVDVQQQSTVQPSNESNVMPKGFLSPVATPVVHSTLPKYLQQSANANAGNANAGNAVEVKSDPDFNI